MADDVAELLGGWGFAAAGPGRWLFRRGPAELEVAAGGAGWAVILTVRTRRRWVEHATYAAELRAAVAVGVGCVRLHAAARRHDPLTGPPAAGPRVLDTARYARLVG